MVGSPRQLEWLVTSRKQTLPGVGNEIIGAILQGNGRENLTEVWIFKQFGGVCVCVCMCVSVCLSEGDQGSLIVITLVNCILALDSLQSILTAIISEIRRVFPLPMITTTIAASLS